MTKDNLIPKTEMVQELKSEIPSFEEFTQNYQSNQAVENSYLSEINGLEKGYGPCVYPNSYCSCDCPRGDYRCNCISDSYGNEKWVKLWISCPSVDRSGKPCPSGSKTPTNWVHSEHASYYTWISNKARIRCEKSDCSASHMSNWSFKCGDSGFHNGQYIKGSFASFNSALTSIINGDWGETSPKVDEVLVSLVLHMKRNKHQFS